jgi:peptidoglycan hydrolase CwlO-like protein
MSLTPEDIKAIAALQTPAPGTVSVQGISKYWPQIVGAVALGWFLVGQGKEQQALVGRVQVVEKSVEAISQVRADQTRTAGEVRELQIAVNSINVSIKDMGQKFDAMGGDVRAMSQQMSAISQSLRTRQ